MNRMKYFIVGLLLIANVNLKGQEPKSEIIKLMDEAAVAWSKSDLDGYMALYSPKATMMGNTGRIGLKAIREVYEKHFFEAGKAKQPLAYTSYEVTMLGKEHALLTGVFILKATEKLKEQRGIFTVIFIREATGWKLLHDHSG
ncbi:MAG: DUF4440 domain-containing protein [Chitinophagaceae bacterium]|nr:MAG: DUF4440 domain-containing protein [Chitinophagaceae bacterium]